MKLLASVLALMAFSVATGAETWAQNSPMLTVTEPELGSWEFAGDHPPLKFDVLAGSPLSFSWTGDASAYGGSIAAYRYGWNVRDPDDDQQWDQNWSATIRSATTRSFNSGSQRFFLQVRDDSGSITSAVFEIAMHQALVLTVTEPTLGSWDFHSLAPPIVQLQVEPGSALNFSWQGSATVNAGPVDAYRYGWDISDTADDSQWTDWCPSCLSAPTTSFDTGSHFLYVQARDNTGMESTAIIKVDVTRVALESSTWSQIKDLFRR